MAVEALTIEKCNDQNGTLSQTLHAQKAKAKNTNFKLTLSLNSFPKTSR